MPQVTGAIDVMNVCQARMGEAGEMPIRLTCAGDRSTRLLQKTRLHRAVVVREARVARGKQPLGIM